MIHYITTNGIGNPWAATEFRIVTKAGINAVFHAMRKPDQIYFKSPEIQKINQETKMIYPVPIAILILSLIKAPLLYKRRFVEVIWNGLTGPRESLTIRLKALWHIVVACYWAQTLDASRVDLIHSQWAHSSATIGMYAAWLLNVPFSFTGHAIDLFGGRAVLLDKIKYAKFIVCISKFHRNFYLKNGARPDQLIISYCGIDTSKFSLKTIDAAREKKPFRILSTGRLVEKKGFMLLIEACKILHEQDFDFECIIAGSGEDYHLLDQRVESLGISDRVQVTGKPLLQEEISDFLHSGDCYCLPCIRSKNDDIDGLPLTLVEAMACGLPSISTNLVGIPDVIINDETGLLIAPNSVNDIVTAIKKLHGDQALAKKLSVAGRQMVLKRFDLSTCVNPVISEFRKYDKTISF